MTDVSLTEQAADRLMAVWQGGELCAPPRDLIGDGDLDAAYAVQDLNTARWQSAGRRIVGRKIGATSKAVQDMVGVDHPSAGVLFDDMQIVSGAKIDPSILHQPFVEAEVAFVLANDLDTAEVDITGVTDAVDYAVAAIEVIGSRIRDWDLRMTDSICDNASSSQFVLGDVRKSVDDFDAWGCGMTMQCGGDEVSVGNAGVCLGGPLHALHWLALESVRRSNPLKAGDIIMSGAMGPIVKSESGNVFDVTIEGLGSVQARF
jgi:2-keto-4-pentenoate hydratase